MPKPITSIVFPLGGVLPVLLVDGKPHMLLFTVTDVNWDVVFQQSQDRWTLGVQALLDDLGQGGQWSWTGKPGGFPRPGSQAGGDPRPHPDEKPGDPKPDHDGDAGGPKPGSDDDGDGTLPGPVVEPGDWPAEFPDPAGQPQPGPDVIDFIPPLGMLLTIGQVPSEGDKPAGKPESERDRLDRMLRGGNRQDTFWQDPPPLFLDHPGRSGIPSLMDLAGPQCFPFGEANTNPGTRILDRFGESLVGRGAQRLVDPVRQNIGRGWDRLFADPLGAGGELLDAGRRNVEEFNRRWDTFNERLATGALKIYYDPRGAAREFGGNMSRGSQVAWDQFQKDPGGFGGPVVADGMILIAGNTLVKGGTQGTTEAIGAGATKLKPGAQTFIKDPSGSVPTSAEAYRKMAAERAGLTPQAGRQSLAQRLPKSNGSWVNGQPGEGGWRSTDLRVRQAAGKPGQPIPDHVDIRFKNGYPIFDDHVQSIHGVKGVTKIDLDVDATASLRTRTDRDFASANRWLANRLNQKKAPAPDGGQWTVDKVKGYLKDQGMQWHHHEDMTTMQLLPRGLHDNTAHIGGRSLKDFSFDPPLPIRKP